MEDVEKPTSIKEAIKCVSEVPVYYRANFATACGGIANDWQFTGEIIVGPPSCAPVEYTNEQWTNKWMGALYCKLGIEPIKENAYYRFIRNGDEFKQAGLGKFRRSLNHRSGEEEGGKSVAIGPFVMYFMNCPLTYLLVGDMLPEPCSDGAPLLATNGNLVVASRLMEINQLLEKFYLRNKTVFDNAVSDHGVEPVDLFNLTLGLWDNWEPTVSR